MPRNVRNFWIDLTVDGRRSRIAAGPAGKNGGFSLVIYQRDKGAIVEMAQIEGAELDGDLSIWFDLRDHKHLMYRTQR